MGIIVTVCFASNLHKASFLKFVIVNKQFNIILMYPNKNFYLYAVSWEAGHWKIGMSLKLVYFLSNFNTIEIFLYNFQFFRESNRYKFQKENLKIFIKIQTLSCSQWIYKSFWILLLLIACKPLLISELNYFSCSSLVYGIECWIFLDYL